MDAAINPKSPHSGITLPEETSNRLLLDFVGYGYSNWSDAKCYVPYLQTGPLRGMVARNATAISLNITSSTNLHLPRQSKIVINRSLPAGDEKGSIQAYKDKS
jgi:hypothetical protein